MKKTAAKKGVDTGPVPGVPWIAVDPGVNTGVALFMPQKANRPWIMGTQTIRGGPGPWIMGMKRIVKEFNELLRHGLYGVMFIEEPFAFTSVATHKGSQLKVDAMYGALCAVAHINGVVVIPVMVSEWKGQLNKKQTQRRTSETMRGGIPINTNEHEWDAIGIACYINQRWNKEKTIENR